MYKEVEDLMVKALFGGKDVIINNVNDQRCVFKNLGFDGLILIYNVDNNIITIMMCVIFLGLVFPQLQRSSNEWNEACQQCQESYLYKFMQ